MNIYRVSRDLCMFRLLTIQFLSATLLFILNFLRTLWWIGKNCVSFISLCEGSGWPRCDLLIRLRLCNSLLEGIKGHAAKILTCRGAILIIITSQCELLWDASRLICVIVAQQYTLLHVMKQDFSLYKRNLFQWLCCVWVQLAEIVPNNGGNVHVAYRFVSFLSAVNHIRSQT